MRTTAAVTDIHQLFMNQSMQYARIETNCLIHNKYINTGLQLHIIITPSSILKLFTVYSIFNLYNYTVKRFLSHPDKFSRN